MEWRLEVIIIGLFSEEGFDILIGLRLLVSASVCVYVCLCVAFNCVLYTFVPLYTQQQKQKQHTRKRGKGTKSTVFRYG